MKKVSVIIAVYNTEEFLDECLTSVVNQTYSNLEVLLINDGSLDQSGAIINEFAKRDKRIICFHNDERKGVSAARNLGLDNATGEFVYFVDSDDFIALDTIGRLVENIGEHDMLTGKRVRLTNKEDSKIGNMVEEEADDGMIIEEIEEKVQEGRVRLRRGIQRSFRGMSILHTLISRDFIKVNNLRFSEEVDCYSDLSFIVPIISEMGTFPFLTRCYYFKRRRNDPISNPAVMQSDREKKVLDFLSIYNQMKDQYGMNKRAGSYLDWLFLNIYRKQIIMLFSNQGCIDEFFNKVAVSVDKIDVSKRKKLNVVVKRELKLLRKRKLESYKRLIGLHHFARNMKRALKSRQKMYIYLYRSVFMRMPLKEKTIVFESFLGKNYSDSPKYIYEYMLEHNYDFKYIWIFNKTGKEIPGNAKQVKRFSLAYYYYFATSKFSVSNSRLPLKLNKREGNIDLQTWHGTPLKKLVFDMNDIYSANPNYKKHFFNQSRRWDYLISPNQYSSDIFRSAFKFEKEMLEFGYPRNDILYKKDNEESIQNLKESLQIPLDKKVILYAPTWRDDEFYEPGKYKFAIQMDLHKMREQLGDEYVVLLRMHYFIADEIDTDGLEGFVYNYSKYDDIAELYLISDILITDYSSVFFDYANLKRPILFFTYDLEKYRDTLRGFYIDIESEVPGPLVKTTDEIIDAVTNIDQVKTQYQETYDRFYDKFCGWDNGNAAENVVKTVFGEDVK
ncbi:teichoic acid biosynthesis protein F [Peribacillus butanolivorans]|uniref:bifunctional glycosyltransferase/CDP-glycerol:glycerophosphate glycerophosphotransferase n=1 Tax=Peribacillus butanolivorans TaxID=421767 RepID=UPI0006A6FA22|nr:CDP-glycerol:glycerophosphate glycerophosphotransferase [Peribacillus butanolivorans]KON67532.1 teichoic acid biosynthesis protein F [Peribacillus butanolivorans]